MKKILLLLLFLPIIVFALTVRDVTTPGRVVDGNLVSDANPNPEVPVFGNIQNSGNGNVTIGWSEVTTDSNGDPITVAMYEIRYNTDALVATGVYNVIAVPPEFTGHSLTVAAGSYSGYVEAYDSNGYSSILSNFTFEVP